MEIPNQPRPMTTHRIANTPRPLPARTKAIPKATSDIIRNPRHTHTERTARESGTEYLPSPMKANLDRIRPGLSSTDAHDRLDVGDPDLAVADLVRPGGLGHRVHDTGDRLVLDDDLHLHLRGEGHLVLGSPVDLGVALLAAVALDLRHGHALGSDVLERLTDRVELERLDYCCDQLHRASP